MRAVVTFVLSFVASTLGYAVIFPNDQHGWTVQGPHIVQWSFVDTDPRYFDLNLTNQNILNFRVNTLAPAVDGKAGPESSVSLQVNPPPGGFQPGSGFRLDLVTSANDPNDSGGILAQSLPFNITA